MSLVVVQTPVARHIENQLYPRGVMKDIRAGFHSSFCGENWRRSNFQAEGIKRVSVERFPPAALCPDCVIVARRWYAPSFFETFDAAQRWRLLANLGRDLAAVA